MTVNTGSEFTLRMEVCCWPTFTTEKKSKLNVNKPHDPFIS